MRGNRAISHRIISDNVYNIDYVITSSGKTALSIIHTGGTLLVEMTDENLTLLKNEIAEINQFLMLPSNIYTKSSVGSLNSDVSFVITSDDIDGTITANKETVSNAPYFLFKTTLVNGYPRLIQVYITPSQLDKLDLITIRDIPFVFPNSILYTEDAVQPSILFTTTNGSFVRFDIPSTMVSALKTNCQTEANHLLDPLVTVGSNNVSSVNVVSKTVSSDEIDIINVSHVSDTNVPYIQFIGTEELRRFVYTIYMTKIMFLDFNTQIQTWI